MNLARLMGPARGVLVTPDDTRMWRDVGGREGFRTGPTGPSRVPRGDGLPGSLLRGGGTARPVPGEHRLAGPLPAVASQPGQPAV
jgi:hypothetical protein